jgi:DNA-binding NtrC family response regulator
VRIIAATNADLLKSVEAGRFREDLFHRLNVINVSVPALRERSEDVPRLAWHFLRKYVHESPFNSPRLSDAALIVLTGYSWPGNVRELEGAVRRALILAERELLEPSDFEAYGEASGCSGEPPPTPSFQEAKALLVQQFERQYLAKLMKDHFGNVSRASRAAGTPRRCLQRLLHKHGLRSISAAV